MLEILAQGTQSAVQPWWVAPISKAISVGVPMAVGVFLGGFGNYYWGVKRERKLRIQARKEELPWRALGVLGEYGVLCRKDMDLRILAQYLSYLPAVLSDSEATKEDRKRVNTLEDSLTANISLVATGTRELINSLGELKGLYVGNHAVVKELDAALAAISNYDAGSFEVPWSEMREKTREQLGSWITSQQTRGSHFVGSQLVRPVRAAIEAINNDADP